MDNTGTILIAESGNHRVQTFTANGTFITQWGSAGSGDGQCNSPVSPWTTQGASTWLT